MPCPRTLEQQTHKTLGGFAPKNLSNNHEIHAIEQCKFVHGGGRSAGPANAVLYLVSDLASFFSGASLVVDGAPQ